MSIKHFLLTGVSYSPFELGRESENCTKQTLGREDRAVELVERMKTRVEEMLGEGADAFCRVLVPSLFQPFTVHPRNISALCHISAATHEPLSVRSPWHMKNKITQKPFASIESQLTIRNSPESRLA